LEKRERERERERERDRERETGRERPGETETDRETERNRDRGTESAFSIILRCCTLTGARRAVEIAISLRKIGIYAVDTRDDEMRQQFMSIGIDEERTVSRKESPDFWFW
jgi:hypothetical protein